MDPSVVIPYAAVGNDGHHPQTESPGQETINNTAGTRLGGDVIMVEEVEEENISEATDELLDGDTVIELFPNHIETDEINNNHLYTETQQKMKKYIYHTIGTTIILKELIPIIIYTKTMTHLFMVMN